MALWNTFKWSDGTKWADAQGPINEFTGLVDRSTYRLSIRITHTNNPTPGSLSSFIIQSISAETGIRPQLQHNYEAFIDCNHTTQRIAVRINQVASTFTEPLLDEASEPLLDEDGTALLVEEEAPFVIDRIHLLASRRARTQPTP